MIKWDDYTQFLFKYNDLLLLKKMKRHNTFFNMFLSLKKDKKRQKKSLIT